MKGDVLPDHLFENVHPAHRQLIRTHCRPWQCAPQPIAMLKQQKKLLGVRRRLRLGQQMVELQWAKEAKDANENCEDNDGCE